MVNKFFSWFFGALATPRCRDCNRPLKSKAAKEAGIGPACARRRRELEAVITENIAEIERELTGRRNAEK